MNRWRAGARAGWTSALRGHGTSRSRVVVRYGWTSALRGPARAGREWWSVADRLRHPRLRPEPVASGGPLRIDFGTPRLRPEPVASGGPLRIDFGTPRLRPEPVARVGPSRIDFSAQRPRPEPVAGGGSRIGRAILVGVILGLLGIGGVVALGLPPTTVIGLPSPAPSTDALPSGPCSSQNTESTPCASIAPVESTAAPADSAAPPSAGVTPIPRATATAQPRQTARPTPGPSPKATVIFKISPTTIFGTCKAGLASFVIQLDNTKSTVAVKWSVSFLAGAYAGDWGVAKPSNGQAAAGQSSTVTITPHDLCAAIKERTDFTLDVLYAATGKSPVSYDVVP